MTLVKSVVVTEFGGLQNLKVTEQPLKNLEKDEIAVDVHFCGINFADLYTRQGMMPRDTMPLILGIECSGIVSAVGENVTDIKVNDRVLCYDYNGGLYRNKVVISVEKCYSIPHDITLKEAASLFVNYLTAYFSINRLGVLQPHQSVFIHSCAGGVGLAAIELCKTKEAVKIYGTTSLSKKPKIEAKKIAGIFEYNNYEEELQNKCPEGIDVILDNQAGKHFTSNLKLLNPFGRLIVIGANNVITDDKQIPIERLQNMSYSISMTNLIIHSKSISGLHLGILAEKYHDIVQQTFNTICELLIDKKIALTIDSVWSLDEIQQATRLLQDRKNVGKVLLHTDNVADI